MISQRNIAIIGASGGIGNALATLYSNREDTDQLIALSRSQNGIDLCNEHSIKHAAAKIADKRILLDVVIVATGLLHNENFKPEKSLSALDPEWMMENYQINAVGPALVAKHFLPLMHPKKRNVFVALSAKVGSISDNRLGGWHSYRASKAALNMIIRNLSIEWQRKNELAVIVGLHPGTVDSALSAPFKNGAPKLFNPNESAAQMIETLERLSPDDSGQLWAYDGQHISP
jgi:NAD(P)-dependent dehydrogenase (short-subunit alcohol dehydrogenase family)